MEVTTSLGRIEYEEQGRGRPVLCFHGGHSNCYDTLWHKGFDVEAFRLITPSRPGYGTTPLANFSSPEAAAKLVKSLLDVLAIKQATVIGISAGGLTALAFAALYPEKMDKLVLLSAVTKKWLQPKDSLYRVGKTMFSARMESISWTMFRGMFKLAPRMMTGVLFKELSTLKAGHFSDLEIQCIKEMTAKQSSGSGFVNDLDQDLNGALLAQIQCPTLIVHSKHDKSVPISMAQFAKEKIKGAALRLTDNKWGHLLWVGPESEAITRSVVDFIEEAI